MSIDQAIALKRDLRGKQNFWHGLHQDGRMYSKSVMKKNPILKYCEYNLEQALQGIFGNHQNVSNIRYIRHDQVLTQLQGFHVDDKAAYENLKSSNDTHSDFKSLGYSIFVGLDKVNTLVIGEPNEETKTIENVQTVQFPFKSVLVITSNLVHQGNQFTSDNDVHHTKDVSTQYSLKGFISVGEVSNDGQGWFVEGRDPFCGPR